MNARENVIFKINFLHSSSIPIEIIDRVSSELAKSVHIDVLVLFDSLEYAVEELPIEGENIQIHRVGISGSKELYSTVPQLLRWIDSRSPSIIHTNHKYSSWLLAHKIRDPSCKYLHTFHSEYRHADTSSILGTFPVFWLYDHITYNSKNTSASFPGMYRWINRPAETVIYNGTNTSLMANSGPSQRTADTTRVLSVGRFVREKNFELAIEAIYRLVRMGFQDIRYDLIGDGALSDDYRLLVEEYDLGDYVRFHGFLPRDHVYEYMWNSDIYLLTSLYEGFCNAAVEAMMAKNILVSSDIEPIRTEVVGEDGIYFQSNDLNSLVDTMVRVLEDVDAYKQSADALSERARRLFPLAKTGENYADVYEALL